MRLLYDEEKYKANTDPHKINYSYHRLLPEELWIHSHVLLFETTVRHVKIECFEQRGYKAFFKAEGDVGFDLLAAMFFLLSRYEEYWQHKKDLYGRYAHQNSVAFKEGFLHLPLINIWLEDFRTILTEHFPNLRLRPSAFRFQATYDIDMAWSFRYKGLKRNAGSLAKLLFSGKWKSMQDRMEVIRGKQQDPFDAYEWMDNLHRQYNLQPLYFFLVAAETGKFDKNTSVHNPSFQALIKKLSAQYKPGLHPSWASGDHSSLLTTEKIWLEKTAGCSITSSRQHYIRFQLPKTYRHLIALGITEDYSMGYGSINGFRASVATPYYWYDLKAEGATPLMLHPFCFMDANSYYEESKTAAQAFDELMQYYTTVHAVGGTMITIWHNSFLGTGAAFDGWREEYQRFVQKVSTTPA